MPLINDLNRPFDAYTGANYFARRVELAFIRRSLLRQGLLATVVADLLNVIDSAGVLRKDGARNDTTTQQNKQVRGRAIPAARF